jgi:TatD DNase family protein
MIDSHCHLDHEPLFENLDEVLKRSKNVGIKKILTICTTLKSFENIIKIINKDDIIYGTFGIHPHETSNNTVKKDEIIQNVNKYKKIIGIGETGLDFYYNNSDKKSQISSFEEHIKASIDMNIPLIVHSRNAENETYDILKNFNNYNIKILMHCFTGSNEFAKKLLSLNAYFSASGIITFKNSVDLQDTFKFLPIENLLIETDSPFLAPVPNRGRKNEPSFIKFTAEKLARIKDISNQELIDKTTQNFNKLFSN